MKMGWGKITLTDKEFFKEACRFADVKNISTASKWWEAFSEVIIRHLYFDGTCRVPNLGTFNTRTVSEQVQIQKGSDGKQKIYQVPERQVPVFYPHDNMIDDINMTGVTKAYRKRMKAGALTQRDYARQIRAESLGVSGSLSKERIENSKKEFQELLEEKRRKFKGRVEPEDED